MTGQLDILATADLLMRSAAANISSLLIRAVQSRGRAMVALSGGSTPRGVYSLLGSEPTRSQIPWEKVHLFWGDERCVPPTDAESNFRMVNETLLQHIIIPSQNVHRIPGEGSPESAAKAYESELRKAFPLNPAATPDFDVMVLGLGADGHIASLFPGTPVLEERQRLVVSVFVEKVRPHRITMTFPVINNAHQILVLVSGTSKAGILAQVLQGDPLLFPAQRIQPVAGKLRWLVDRDAASQLYTVVHQ